MSAVTARLCLFLLSSHTDLYVCYILSVLQGQIQTPLEYFLPFSAASSWLASNMLPPKHADLRGVTSDEDLQHTADNMCDAHSPVSFSW